MHVVGIDFDTAQVSDWTPDDPLDCEVWANVNVGDERGAAYFQLHICTPQSIRRIADKRNAFVIDEFVGIPDLIARLDAFIEAKLKDVSGDPYQALAKYWRWEY